MQQEERSFAKQMSENVQKLILNKSFSESGTPLPSYDSQ